jgi:flagellar basal body-associated protein FliL
MQDGLPPLQPWEEVKLLLVEIAKTKGVTENKQLRVIMCRMERTEAYAVYTQATDEDKKREALGELRNVIESEVNRYKQSHLQGQSQLQPSKVNDDQSDDDQSDDDQSDDDQSDDDQSDDDQKKFLRIGIIALCVVLTLALGFYGVLPGLGIAILVGVKFASHFSEALKFGLGIFFIAPLAITLIAIVTFFLKSFIKSKLAAQSQINEVKDNVVQTDVIDVQAQEQDMNEQASDIVPTH